jgi:Polyketide cyclase / dehydrase and lipid transport
VSHTESTTIRVPREHHLRWVNSDEVDLSDLIQGSEGLPRVVGTTVLRGSFEFGCDRVGARRGVELSNGHFVAEEVVEDSPERFRYMIWGFTSYQRLAIDHAVAEFIFEDRSDQTKVTWTYSFHPRSRVVRPLVARFVNSAWVGLMRNALEGMRTGAETSLASSRR